MPFDFHDKRAVVTGGAHGIGRAMASELVRGGAEVWIFDIEAPEQTAAAIGARGIAVDVTRREALESALDRCGIPDIVMVNAGTGRPASLFETTAADWDFTIALNLTGAFHTLQAAASRMRRQGRGSIVLTASTNSYDGEPDLTAYNASKAGLLGLLHTSANELGPYGIRVNAVCPGLIRTRLTEAQFSSPERLKDYFRHIPLGRGGLPEEVAHAAAFLASDLASYITGATLFVDGGQMAGKFGTWNEERAAFDGDHWRLKPEN